MALATQCPHCHTTFRVAHDQLKLRAGIVRCGQCRQVFNGIEHLLPPAGKTSTAAEADLGDAGGLILPGAASQPASAAAQTAASQIKTEMATCLPSDAASESAPQAAEPDAAVAKAVQTTPAETADALDELDYAALEGMTLMHFPLADQAEEEPPHPAASPAEHDSDPLQAPDIHARIEPSPAEPWPAAAPDFTFETDPQDEPGFVTAARRQQHRKPRNRLLFGTGAAVLTLALLIQAAYALRSPIAANLPQAKPALLAICRTLGCGIALPAQIDTLSIESSELQTQPGAPDTFTLMLLLRNRSSTLQAWPNMELTLNDGSEHAILRRVFTPREFPLSRNRIASGFAADSEQTIRLTFTLTQVKAAGYRVVLFYP